MTAGLELRSATDDDLDLVRRTLYLAVSWDMDDPVPPIEAIVDRPDTAVYHERWMREGDRGVVAEVDGVFVGMAYYRLFRADATGHGWVDEETPEVAIGVLAEHRGRGVGTALLAALHEDAAAAGTKRLSLYVIKHNRARELYEAFGYRTVRSTDEALVMVADTEEAAPIEEATSGGAVSPVRVSNPVLRPAMGSDHDLVRRTLYTALAWDPNDPIPGFEQVVNHPEVAIYHEGWGRAGDHGVVAEDGHGVFMGMAYGRLFPPGTTAQGWIDADTPELAVAVEPEFRGMGIGQALIDALHRAVSSAGIGRMSLSVALGNPARKLYERVGYQTIEERQTDILMAIDLGQGQEVSSADAP